jgi:hypothetical protein
MRRPWIIPFVAMLAMGLPFMVSWWARWDSAVHAAVAWRMALSGDWLSMWAGESSYFNKPPLAIWVLAGVFKAGLACGLLSPDTGPPVWLIRAVSGGRDVVRAAAGRDRHADARCERGRVGGCWRSPPFFVLLNEKVVDFWHLLGPWSTVVLGAGAEMDGRGGWSRACRWGSAVQTRGAATLPVGLAWLAWCGGGVDAGVAAVGDGRGRGCAVVCGDDGAVGDAFVHAHFGQEVSTGQRRWVRS